MAEYWDCAERVLTWPDADGPDMVVDDGGDATLLIHEGVKWELTYAKTGACPDPEATGDKEFKELLRIIRRSILEGDP